MAYSDPTGVRPSDEAPGHSVVRVLGVPFASLDLAEAIELVRTMLRGVGSHQIVIANAHTLNLAQQDPAYLGMLQHATLVLRDGVGVEIASRFLGKRLVYNFVGTDFVPLLLRTVANPRIRVFLYGAAPNVAVAAGEALTKLAPGIEIAGSADGYGVSEDVVRQVQSSQADVVLVALGNPLQEQWIAANLGRLNVRLAIGVGALFDFLGKRVPRAPQWMRQARLEWLFRLSREPGRLGRRYVIGNAQFLWRVVRTARSERV
jgi:exopolysaccharide biosynthesis WecB/TagA/CpsF family protein